MSLNIPHYKPQSPHKTVWKKLLNHVERGNRRALKVSPFASIANRYFLFSRCNCFAVHNVFMNNWKRASSLSGWMENPCWSCCCSKCNIFFPLPKLARLSSSDCVMFRYRITCMGGTNKSSYKMKIISDRSPLQNKMLILWKLLEMKQIFPFVVDPFKQIKTYSNLSDDFTTIILHVYRNIYILAVCVSRFVQRCFEVHSTFRP